MARRARPSPTNSSGSDRAGASAGIAPRQLQDITNGFAGLVPVGRFRHLGIRGGSWPLFGQEPGWDRSVWPDRGRSGHDRRPRHGCGDRSRRGRRRRSRAHNRHSWPFRFSERVRTGGAFRQFGASRPVVSFETLCIRNVRVQGAIIRERSRRYDLVRRITAQNSLHGKFQLLPGSVPRHHGHQDNRVGSPDRRGPLATFSSEHRRARGGI